MKVFKKFCSEQEEGRMPEIFYADYFDNGCSPIAPQFLLLKWEWYDGEGPQAGLLRPTPPNRMSAARSPDIIKKASEET
jgi:hypothetical protein